MGERDKLLEGHNLIADYVKEVLEENGRLEQKLRESDHDCLELSGQLKKANAELEGYRRRFGPLMDGGASIVTDGQTNQTHT